MTSSHKQIAPTLKTLCDVPQMLKATSPIRVIKYSEGEKANGAQGDKTELQAMLVAKAVNLKLNTREKSFPTENLVEATKYTQINFPKSFQLYTPTRTKLQKIIFLETFIVLTKLNQL